MTENYWFATILVLLLTWNHAHGFVHNFRGLSSSLSNKIYKHDKVNKIEVNLVVGPIDIPFIPAVLLTTGAVFAVFNIDNKVDLTDSGRAAAKRQKRLEREAKGEYKKADPTADPFRYKWFEENDDDEFELLNKPKGGGCG